MLQDANRAQILSRTSLNTIDNNVSVVNVGQSIPVLGGTVSNVNGIQQNVNYVNAGLTLQIQPRTNEDGLINMIVAISRATIDRANGLEVANGAVGGGTTLTPAFNQTIAQTRVTAYDGQTVVIGGLISKSRASTSRRVPWLADIPIAGALFRYDKEVENRTELLVVMTPRVVNFNDASKLDMIKMVESSRMSWCLADVLNIYGDKGLSPGNGLWGPAASPVIYPDETPTVEFNNASDGQGYPTEAQPMTEPIPQEPVEGQLYFGEPSDGNPPATLFPSEPTSSRNPRRSLIQGSSYQSYPPANVSPSSDNASYQPIGAMPILRR
jgi:hypothetical protein